MYTIRRTPDSGTGPDGLPNSAWKAAGMYGATLLYSVFLSMCTFSIVPWGLNFLKKCFIPKKRFFTHLDGGAAHSSDLRPLGLKNSDIKAIAVAVVFSCSGVVAEFAHFSQKRLHF